MEGTREHSVIELGLEEYVVGEVIMGVILSTPHDR